MPQSWADIMGARNWTAATEQTSRRSIAAWQWYLEGYPRAQTRAETQGRAAPGLEDAVLSGLLGVRQIVQNTVTKTLSASLGHATYAILLYPVQVVHENLQGLKTMRMQGPPATMRFDYIVDIAEWQVLPHRAVRHAEHGLVLEQTAPAEPLVRAALRQPAQLSFRTLARLAQHLGVNIRGQPSSQALLTLIAQKLETADAAYVQEVMHNFGQPAPVHLMHLMQDPVFEAAYEEMPPEEQCEFPELRREQIRGRVRRHMAGKKVEVQAKRMREEGGGHRPLRQRRVRARRGPRPAEDEGMAAAVAGEAVVVPATMSAGAVAPAPLPPGQDSGRAAQADPVPHGPECPVPPAAQVLGAPAGPAPPAAPAHPAPPPADGTGGRVPRGVLWDRHHRFWIARTHRNGEFESVTVTCLLHRHDGARCNTNLALGRDFNEAQATNRIQEWCARGLEIVDDAGGRARHMALRPRYFDTAEIRSTEELEALVNL